MTSKNKNVAFKVDIGTNEPKQWTAKDISTLKSYAKKNAKNRTKEQKLKLELFALQFEQEASNSLGSDSLLI